MIFNKRGTTAAATPAGEAGRFPIFPVLVIVGLILLFSGLLWLGYVAFGEGFSSDEDNLVSFSEAFGKASASPTDKVTKLLTSLDYVFGPVPRSLADGSSTTTPPIRKVGGVSAGIIVIAVWFFIFLTFGDIISTFGSFSKGISWVLALLLTVVFANLHGPMMYLGFFLGMFSFAGGIAVITGMFAAFAAFVATNWGVISLGPWLMHRKMMMYVSRMNIEEEIGSKKVTGAIAGLGTIADELAKQGRKRT